MKKVILGVDRLIMSNPAYLAVPIWSLGLVALFWTSDEAGITPVYLSTMVAMFWTLTWFVIKLGTVGK